jgi:hypothetical protein
VRYPPGEARKARVLSRGGVVDSRGNPGRRKPPIAEVTLKWARRHAAQGELAEAVIFGRAVMKSGDEVLEAWEAVRLAAAWRRLFPPHRSMNCDTRAKGIATSGESRDESRLGSSAPFPTVSRRLASGEVCALGVSPRLPPWPSASSLVRRRLSALSHSSFLFNRSFVAEPR